MRTKTKEFLLAMLASFVIVFFLILAGWSDLTAEEADQELYCEMVRNGAWPDYNKTFKTECDHKVQQADIR